MTLGALILVTAKASVFLNVLALGMSARLTDAIHVLRRPGLFLRCLLAMGVIMPLFAVGLGIAFDLHPVVKVALVAIAVSPVPPLLPRKLVSALVSIAYIKRMRGGGGAGGAIPELVKPAEQVIPLRRRAGAV
jgi:bile acid:Na+ symporter, BASS family